MKKDRCSIPMNLLITIVASILSDIFSRGCGNLTKSTVQKLNLSKGVT